MKGLDLKKLREQASLTQEELAKKIGVTRKTINTHENSDLIPESKSKLYLLFFQNLTISENSQNFISDFTSIYSTGIDGNMEISEAELYKFFDVLKNYYHQYSKYEHWIKFEKVIRTDQDKKIAEKLISASKS